MWGVKWLGPCYLCRTAHVVEQSCADLLELVSAKTELKLEGGGPFNFESFT